MTPLKKMVRRKVTGRMEPRELVVSLIPNDGGPALIEVREARRRTGYTIGVSSLFMMLAVRQADLDVELKRRARRGKRGAR